MPKAKPVSLHPLSFDEAIKALIVADPKRTGVNPNGQKKTQKAKTRKTS
jgi:hypothetical protein